MWFSRRKKAKRSRKSPFGGEVKSQREVKALNQKIRAQEKQEFEAFEQEFERHLAEL